MMEPKQEPEEERLTESPVIRVCDTPSPHSPPSPSSTYSSHSPPPSSIVAPMLPIFPPMMFLNPYLSLPLQRFPQLPLPPLLPPRTAVRSPDVISGWPGGGPSGPRSPRIGHKAPVHNLGKQLRTTSENSR